MNTYTLKKRAIIVTSLLLALVLITFILRQLAPILKPFFIAVFLCDILLPGIDSLEKRKIPKFLSYVIVILGVSLIFYLLGFFTPPFCKGRLGGIYHIGVDGSGAVDRDQRYLMTYPFQSRPTGALLGIVGRSGAAHRD